MTTENEYLELANHAKQSIEKRDLYIEDLEKIIYTLYGLSRALDDTIDLDLTGHLRCYASEGLECIKQYQRSIPQKVLHLNFTVAPSTETTPESTENESE
jgi:hypothetical protein